MHRTRLSLSSVAWTLGAVLAVCVFVSPAWAAPRRAGRPQPAAGALSIAQLTPMQRANMPPATRVRFKSGRVATLGVLRQSHRRRLARFTRFARMRPSVVSTGSAHGKLVAMASVTQGPLDYRGFCNAAHASGCLWFPPAPVDEFSTGLLSPYESPNIWVDTDPLITDGTVCASEGGTESSEGCSFAYPAVYASNFNPGAPPPGQPIGAGVTWNQTCAADITTTVDQHGAIKLAAPVAAGTVHVWNDGPAGESCVVKVYLPAKAGKAARAAKPGKPVRAAKAGKRVRHAKAGKAVGAAKAGKAVGKPVRARRRRPPGL